MLFIACCGNKIFDTERMVGIMLKKTKIVCTMGPSTEKKGVLDALLANGMNCARFNFSHGSHEEHKARINQVRAAAKKADKVVSLILDTKGPEMRLGEFKDGKVQLEKGKRFVPDYEVVSLAGFFFFFVEVLLKT